VDKKFETAEPTKGL